VRRRALPRWWLLVCRKSIAGISEWSGIREEGDCKEGKLFDLRK
jgi:hypothetical protein